MKTIIPELVRAIVAVDAGLMVRYSEDVSQTVVANEWDLLSFNIDVTTLCEELNAVSDRPVQINKEILSDVDGITNCSGKVLVAVEINAECRGEITAVGE